MCPSPYAVPSFGLQPGAQDADHLSGEVSTAGAVERLAYRPAVPRSGISRPHPVMNGRCAGAWARCWSAHDVIDDIQLDELLAEQAALRPSDGSGRMRLGQLVVFRGLGTEEQVADALGDLLALDVVDLSTEPVDPTVAQLIPRAMAERFGLIVLAREETGLRVAASDPTNVLALWTTCGSTRANGRCTWSSPPHRRSPHRSSACGRSAMTRPTPSSCCRSSTTTQQDDDDTADQTPTVRLLDALLGDAVRDGASDIHVEPQRDACSDQVPDRRTAARHDDRSTQRRTEHDQSAEDHLRSRHLRASSAAGRSDPDQRQRHRR